MKLRLAKEAYLIAQGLTAFKNLDPILQRSVSKLNGELCICLERLEILFFFFLVIDKLCGPVCFTVPACKPKAAGRGIAIRAKVEQ